MTTPTSSTPQRPGDPGAAALYDALNTEYATIYGYGIVSAHSGYEVNDLVSEALATHRAQREQSLSTLASRSVTPPLAATGYRLPFPVNNPDDAAKLAVQMESDTATAWRAVLEQAPAGSGGDSDRRFAAGALAQSAVFAARWRRVLGQWPITTAFPGGSE